MIVEQIRTGGDRNFAYLVGSETGSEAFVVDPSFWPEKVVNLAEERGFRILYIFNTHGHADHTNGNEEIHRETGVEPVRFGDRHPNSGVKLTHNAVLPLGDEQLRILHTPGHTEDSISILAGGNLFTGDTLFVGKVGGTEQKEQARRQYKSLHEVLMKLPDETIVWPGHDVGQSPSSTIGQEKKSNPFLMQPDFESFLELKTNWLAYKKKHNIA